MRRMGQVRRLLLCTLCAMGLGSSAGATTFAEMSIEQFTDASTYIVKGVVEAEPTTTLEGEQVFTTASIQVTETLKGPDHPAHLEVRQHGGTFEGATSQTPGQAVFSQGESVLLFLHQDANGHLVPVSKFRGKYTLRRAPGERQTYVRQWQQSERAAPYDHRFLPHPEAKDRLYLSTLENQIRSRVATGWDGNPIPGLDTTQLERINTSAGSAP